VDTPEAVSSNLFYLGQYFCHKITLDALEIQIPLEVGVTYLIPSFVLAVVLVMFLDGIVS
jgi:hypothetical protein